MTAFAVMGLLPDTMTVSGQIRLDGSNTLEMTERQRCELRGNRVGMVFQEPMTALNPTMRVGAQIAEVVRIHRGLRRRAAWQHAVELLARVEFPDPAAQARRYPHQLSGGQRQRVALAIAIACDPAVILADEPTTALDVTVQAQMLDLMSRLVDEQGAALLLISHDLAVVDRMCSRVVTMYGGRIVESGETRKIFGEPRHPYTAGLRSTSAAVSLDSDRTLSELPFIPGQVPGVGRFPPGCPFRTRCTRASEECATMPPLTAADERLLACWHPITPTASLAAAGTDGSST
jgi:peptide/nickel transport system ATP-binding protein